MSVFIRCPYHSASVPVQWLIQSTASCQANLPYYGLPYGTGQIIIRSSCGFFFLSSSFFFFLASSQPSQIGCLPYFHTWCGLSVNLRCRCGCTRLAVNTGCKKSRQKSPSGHHRTTLSGYIFATKARIDNRKKTC